MRRHLFVLFPIVSALILNAGAALAEPANPGHALAQKFAEDAKPKPAPAQAAPAAPRVAKPAANPSADYEKEMLDAAKSEAEARRRAAAAAIAAETAAATQLAAPKAAEAKPVTTPEPQKVAEPAHAAPAAPKVPMQIKVKAEIRVPVTTAPAAALAAPAKSTTQTAAAAGPPRATVLVVLTHHAEASGSPRKTPDPIICLGEECYISAGPDTDARAVTRAEALSTKNTITNGAGACSGKTRCAFRGVAVKPGAELQIVDLGLVRHDKRDVVEAKLDTTCGLDETDLVCDNPLTAPDFRIWLMPEAIARDAGATRIEAALADDLPEENIVRDGDK
jgi:colicin import membrane protein